MPPPRTQRGSIPTGQATGAPSGLCPSESSPFKGPKKRPLPCFVGKRAAEQLPQPFVDQCLHQLILPPIFDQISCKSPPASGGSLSRRVQGAEAREPESRTGYGILVARPWIFCFNGYGSPTRKPSLGPVPCETRELRVASPSGGATY